jgi:glycosyltransferase involved in cell wall biosynthesis
VRALRFRPTRSAKARRSAALAASGRADRSAVASASANGAGRTAPGRIICFATQGQGHIEGERIRALLELSGAEDFAFDRSQKLRSALRLMRTVATAQPQLIVMEGTGTAGGLVLLLARTLWGVPYVISSGDAVGPFLGLRSRALGLLGAAYERMLCRFCAGFVGWTPYLVGRALAFGAPRAMTAPGWTRSEPSGRARSEVRRELGISEDAIVIGLAGSLHWNEAVGYVYGAEIVQAVCRCPREDLVACIVGDGDGLQRLRDLAGDQLGTRVLLPGRVAPERVPDYLSAFDLGSLSQSVDKVGSFRYTTKLSEYLAAGLAVVSGEIPAAYDLDEGYMWRLPGAAPWSAAFVDSLTALLDRLDRDEVDRRREAASAAAGALFDKGAQQRRMSEFVADILASRRRSRTPDGS